MLLIVAVWLAAVGHTQAACLNYHTWEDFTPLDEYVNRPDNVFSYELIDTYNMTDLPGENNHGCMAYVLNVTSHRWMDESFSDRATWFHYQFIFVPADNYIMTKEHSLLVINGGDNDDPYAGQDDEFVFFTCLSASQSHMITSLHTENPNQPIVYKDDPLQESRKEDNSIAYTWRHFLDDPTNPEKILEFPQAKGGVRAMDVVNLWGQENVPGSNFDKFCVTGASKRGWATWVVGAVDQRVKCMVPMVMPIGNTQQNFHSHNQNLGGWSFAMTDYYEQNVTKDIDSYNADLIFTYIDPYCYKERMTMPKLQLSATGDEFFMLDATYDFWDGFLEPWYHLMLQNAEHSLFGKYRRIQKAIGGFWLADVLGVTKPSVSWEMQMTNASASIRLTTDSTPTELHAWAADTAPDHCRRDFRAASLDQLIQVPVWRNVSDMLQQESEFVWSIEVAPSPEACFTGVLINALYEFPVPEFNYFTLDFTTEVAVTPNYRPFPKCTTPEECYGVLV